jgi:hypothetical protein
MLKQVPHDVRGNCKISGVGVAKYPAKGLNTKAAALAPLFCGHWGGSSSPIHNISATLCACLCAVPSKRLGGADKII